MIDVIKKHFSLLCDLRRKYKIEIVTDVQDNDPVINYKISDKKTLTPYLEFLRDELAIYPVTLVNKLQLDRIVLCSHLAKLDKPVSGCASMSLFPDSLPLRMLFKKNTIYLDIIYGGTMDGRVTVHHELFHAVESHGDTWPRYLDEQWPKLNPPAFRYREEAQERASKYSVDVDGFLTDYSMESVREDKAELFSHMIVNLARVEKFARKDAFLKAKVDRMKQLMRKFCYEVNDDFWTTRNQQSDNGGSLFRDYDDLLLNRLR
ncbi:MAG: putative zinc-binding metallopeptidase [Candidatus Melainabacteria bacterium]|nr:putative zinc-binding metallopeptidase [Candidatus Melainabacteria bacterium]